MPNHPSKKNAPPDNFKKVLDDLEKDGTVTVEESSSMNIDIQTPPPHANNKETTFAQILEVLHSGNDDFPGAPQKKSEPKDPKKMN